MEDVKVAQERQERAARGGTTRGGYHTRRKGKPQEASPDVEKPTEPKGYGAVAASPDVEKPLETKDHGAVAAPRESEPVPPESESPDAAIAAMIGGEVDDGLADERFIP